MLTRDDFNRLNHTEAYQLCREVGIPCLPSDPKDTLLNYLSVTWEPRPVTEGQHPVDSWRHGIAGFVLDHWSMVQAQLTCPLRSGDPRSCFNCVDTKVVECVVKNKMNEPKIELHRRKD